MPTNRARVRRQHRPQFTPRVLELFRTMETARKRCTCEPIDWVTPDAYWKNNGGECAACEAWWAAHNELHDLLGLKPWEWPAFEHPDDTSPYPEGCVADQRWHADRVRRPEAFKLYEELKAAERAAR